MAEDENHHAAVGGNGTGTWAGAGTAAPAVAAAMPRRLSELQRPPMILRWEALSEGRRSQGTGRDTTKAPRRSRRNPQRENELKLLVAASEGNLDHIKALVINPAQQDQMAAVASRRALLQCEDSVGCTPLVRAVIADKLEVVQFLVRHGAQLEDKTATGCDCFQLSKDNTREWLVGMRRKVDEVMAVMAGEGGGSDKKAKKKSKKQCAATVQELVQQDALVVLVPGTSGETLLAAACREGQLDVVQAVLASPCHICAMTKPDATGRTPLHVAAEHNRLDVVQALQQAGAPTDVADDANLTPAATAARAGHVHVVAALFELPGGRECAGPHDSVLLAAARAGQEAVVKWLLLQTPPVPSDTTNSNGQTVLHVAAAQGHFGVVKRLANGKSVGVDTPDKHGRTPFLLACLHGHLDVAKLLVKSGANIATCDNLGKTARALARHPATADWLKRKKAPEGKLPAARPDSVVSNASITSTLRSIKGNRDSFAEEAEEESGRVVAGEPPAKGGHRAVASAVANTTVAGASDVCDIWPRRVLGCGAEKLRVLIIRSNSRLFDGCALETDREERLVRQALRRSPLAASLELSSIGDVRISDIQDELESFRPHCIHFVGHHRANSGFECVTDDDTFCWLSGEAFRTMLERLSPQLRVACVVFNCCNSLDFGKALQPAVAGVVCMENYCVDTYGLAFAEAFWQELLSGADLPTVFAQAETAVQRKLDSDRIHSSVEIADPQYTLLLHGAVEGST